MNAPKPADSLAGQLCPACRKGHFALVQINHTEELPQDNPVTLRAIWVDRCDSCGETTFPAETVQFIEAAVAEQTEQLAPRDLQICRENLEVETQDEMSEILGLGSKTFHRWERGHQFPNRSMSYYIRVLAEFPQAFEWLRARAWRNKNRIANPDAVKELAAMFPDLAAAKKTTTHRDQFQLQSSQPKRNPARGLIRVAFSTK